MVEIHGQHEQQRLLSGAWQRDILDAFGGHDDLRANVAGAVASWRANEAALRELAVDPAELQRRLELATHAADEIEAAAPRARRSRPAARAPVDRRQRRAHQVAGARPGRVDRAARAEPVTGSRSTRGRQGSWPASTPAKRRLSERLNGLAAEADDVALDLRRLTTALADDPTDASAIEERLGLLYALLRKYGASEEEVLAHAAGARAEADRLAGFESERKRRSADAEVLEQRGARGGGHADRSAPRNRRAAVDGRDGCAHRARLPAGRLRHRPDARRPRCFGRR